MITSEPPCLELGRPHDDSEPSLHHFSWRPRNGINILSIWHWLILQGIKNGGVRGINVNLNRSLTVNQYIRSIVTFHFDMPLGIGAIKAAA